MGSVVEQAAVHLLLAVSAYYNACCHLRPVETRHDPKPTRHLRTHIYPKMGPHFRVETVSKELSENKWPEKITLFGPIKVDWFFGQKTFVFSFQKPPVRDGLR